MSETYEALYYVHMLGLMIGVMWISMAVYFQTIMEQKVRPIIIVTCLMFGLILILMSNAVFVHGRAIEMFLRVIGYTIAGMLASCIFTYIVIDKVKYYERTP